jgi:hypothetical protein
MGRGAERDFFDKARDAVGAGLFLAGAAAIIGAMLDWFTFTLPEPAGTVNVGNQRPSLPISGFDGRHGWWVVGGGIVLVVCAFLLVLRGRAVYSGIALLASIVVGSLAISDYRGAGEIGSDLSRQLNIVGETHVAAGLILVVAAALLGVISSVAGIAASPRTDG